MNCYLLIQTSLIYCSLNKQKHIFDNGVSKIRWTSEVGIYKRKQESKKTRRNKNSTKKAIKKKRKKKERKHALDQESDEEKKE